SIVGFVALTKKSVKIDNAYDAQALKTIHPQLKFDSSWDKKTGFTTKQMLTTAIMYETYRMGVIQVLNKKDGPIFTAEDEKALNEIAKTLGIAFYNQRRITRSTQPNKFGYLIDKGIISEQDLEDAVTYAKMNNQNIPRVLIDKYRIHKEEVLKSLGQYYHTNFFSFDGIQKMPKDFVSRFNEEYLKKILVAPLAKQGATAQFAIEDPSDLQTQDTVRIMRLASRNEFLVALREDIIEYINLSYGISDKGNQSEFEEDEEEESLKAIIVDLEKDSEDDFDEDEEIAGLDLESAVVRLANKIVVDAYKQGASDIHIEPYGKKAPVRVRFRVDGICHVHTKVPASHRAALVSRLKIMSNLDIAERRLPQDGKIKFKMKNNIIELRVATIPTTGREEDIVMRILAASKPLPLDKMGFSKRNLSVFEKIIIKPYGIILCVGPTGSGKTTTLHSALGYINTPERKIWTAEDPVEITQPGLRQVQVKPSINFTFGKAMRAFLRADPDVIMVGEMRDQETANIGIEASLTGHLVLSTLHTNSAPETITRLFDMKIDPYNFADALLGILAQRLARTVCKKCKVAYHPAEDEYEDMILAYGKEDFTSTRISYSPDLTLYQPKGCPECAGTGYKGRMGLHELMEGTDEIKRVIQKKSLVEEIRRQAMSDGMTTLMQDGIEKVLQGALDMKQVRAVCIK
ncbi:ATPase, T2SS/T4P/T4SS family, partial [candidate division CSSED10-310 bacterium]